MKRNKVLLLMSGGYDSTLCLSLLSSLGYEGECLFFDYGQESYKEEALQVYNNVLKYGGFSFSVSEIKIEAPWLVDDMDKPTGYFPSRNVIFLSYALSYAEAKGYDGIVIGLIGTPETYPDSSLEFIDTFNDIANEVGKFVWCPLINMSKNEVYELGGRLGIEFKDTWSCDFPDAEGNPCGKCGSCIDIAEGKKEKLI